MFSSSSFAERVHHVSLALLRARIGHINRVKYAHFSRGQISDIHINMTPFVNVYEKQVTIP